MILHRKKRESTKYYKTIISRPKLASIVIVLFMFLVAIISVYTGGILQRNGVLSDVYFDLSSAFNRSKVDISSYFNKEDKIDISIGFKELKRLDHQRIKNRKRGYGVYTNDDWVDASMVYKNEKYKIKIRLKGMSGEHWNLKSSRSYRIKIKKDKAIFGMRKLTLQPHKFRGSLSEWVFMKMLKDSDMIAHRLEFVEVVINGDSSGLYAIQEQYDKLLIENNNRKEGPIMGFDKDLYISEVFKNKEAFDLRSKDGFYSAPLTVNSENKYIADERMSSLIQTGFQMLEGFRSKKLKPTEVFEYKMFAKLLAIRALLGSDEFDWRDIRFYMNPVTMKLEPIGREVHDSDSVGIKWWKANMNYSSNESVDAIPFHKAIFSDRLFYEEYIKQLNKVSQPDFLKNFYMLHGEELLYLEGRLRSFDGHEFPYKRIENRRKIIEEFLNPIRAISAHISATDVQDLDFLNLSIGAIQPLRVNIGCVFFNDKKIMCPVEKNSYVEGKKDMHPVEFKNIKMRILNKELNLNNGMNLTYTIPGIDKEKLTPISIWKISSQLIKEDIMSLDDNIHKLSWMDIDKNNKTIRVHSGIYHIDKTLKFPLGFDVYVDPGVKIILNKGANLIFKDTVYFKGKKGLRIEVDSSNDGGGMFVLNANKRSILDYVVFSESSAVIHKNLKLSGAITFYQSDVSISNTIFKGNSKGDDFLNIIRSSFSIDNSKFENVLFDALDSDFSKGTVSNSSFSSVGNDALDFSGSEVVLNNLKINKVGDKAMSVGERSDIKASNISILNSYIGIASKDSSRVLVNNINFYNTEYIAAAYQKKPEFGPASISFDNSLVSEDTPIYIIGDNSIINFKEQGRVLSRTNEHLLKSVTAR
jgi:hypothetical protein